MAAGMRAEEESPTLAGSPEKIFPIKLLV